MQGVTKEDLARAEESLQEADTGTSLKTMANAAQVYRTVHGNLCTIADDCCGVVF